MRTQFKPNASLCRHGMRDCPVKQCSFHNSRPTTLYSSSPSLKGPAPTTPALDKLTAMDGPLAKQHQFITHDKFTGEARRIQHALATPSHPTVSDPVASLLSGTSGTGTNAGSGSVDPMDGNGLEQAADEVAIYRGWLKGQMDAQKARIKAMSEQFSIPVPNLELNPFDSPPLSLMAPSAGNAVATITNKATMPQENKKKHVSDERKVPSAPPAPRIPPALPVQGLWQPEPQGSPHTGRATASGPLSARAPMSPRPSPFDQQGPNTRTPTVVVSKDPQVTSIAPKKDDMAYKTTPCRHFTLNQGWCPWGDECGFIHDPQLGWVPPLERTSGSSTPNSSTLGGNKSGLPDKTAIDVAVDSHRSVSSKSAHCWGYIQGICPHLDTCKYLHPADIVPYIKYTPCLTHPRCGYPARDCPLKHPQVDKLIPARQTQPSSTLSTTPIVPQARSATAPRAETSDVPLSPQHHSQPPFMTPALFTPVGGLVIPHDEAYASAKLHHRPTAPSAEMFSPAPVRPLVRLRRPSEDMPQDQATEMQCGIGMGPYQGRPRSVSIAVQKLGAQFSGPVLQTQAKAFVRGHGRGKSLNV